MGLWEFLQQWSRGRIVAGVAASVLLHLVVMAILMWAGQFPLTPPWRAKPGDALIVELPKPEEPASAGQRGAPPVPVALPTPAARPAPPQREQPPARQERVASAVRTPAPPKPAPRSAERAARAPEPPSTPPPAPRVAPPDTADPSGIAHSEERSAPVKPAEAAPPAGAPATGPAAQPEREVASVAPGAVAAVPPTDIRHALRRGAGGPGGGRGGIEGDAIPLDSKDGRYSDFLEKVRQRIKAQWGYPCVKNLTTRECEYLSAQLEVEFGILKSGDLQFVDIVRSSGYEIYDGYAVTAIRLASPYPRVPPEMMAQMKSGSTGTIIFAKFNYIAETSLTNIR